MCCEGLVPSPKRFRTPSVGPFGGGPTFGRCPTRAERRFCRISCWGAPITRPWLILSPPGGYDYRNIAALIGTAESRSFVIADAVRSPQVISGVAGERQEPMPEPFRRPSVSRFGGGPTFGRCPTRAERSLRIGSKPPRALLPASLAAKKKLSFSWRLAAAFDRLDGLEVPPPTCGKSPRWISGRALPEAIAM